MSSPPANVNEGERWTITGMYESTLVRIDSGRTLDRDESVEVVPAKALREAEEELERLREALADFRRLAAVCVGDRDVMLRGNLPYAGEREDAIESRGNFGERLLGKWPSPSAPAESSVSKPEAGLDGSER